MTVKTRRCLGWIEIGDSTYHVPRSSTASRAGTRGGSSSSMAGVRLSSMPLSSVPYGRSMSQRTAPPSVLSEKWPTKAKPPGGTGSRTTKPRVGSTPTASLKRSSTVAPTKPRGSDTTSSSGLPIVPGR